MSVKRTVAAALCGASGLLGAGLAWSQAYPSKPLRFVTSEVGGGSDFAARSLAVGLSSTLGQQVVVDNRASMIGIETVAKAPAQGYTLLVASNPLWLLPLMQSVRYDPVRDFAPISLVARAPSILVVHPSVAASSVKELIALARSRPGVINCATGASGSTGHLSAELFKSMAAIDIVRVPYKGGGPALIDLIGGQVQMLFSSPGSVTPHVNSGKLRALAVTSAEPSALVPTLATVAASGLPGYEAVGNYSVFAPVATPAAIVDHLNREIVRTLNRADVKDRYFNGGVETVGSTPQELAAKVKAEMARMGKVIKDAGIRAE